MRFRLIILLLLIPVLAIGQQLKRGDAFIMRNGVFLAIEGGVEIPPVDPDPDPEPSGAIIADHTIVDDYDKIPQRYIDEVKKMWVSIAGESHSYGYRQGAERLYSSDNRFPVLIRESGTPDSYRTNALRLSRATWGDVNNSSGWRYDYGEEDWWETPLAITRTKASIDYCNTTGPALAAFGFGWCYDDYTNTDDYIETTQEYVDYCKLKNYDTKIIFTTGPVDGYTSGSDAAYNHTRWQKIRDYINNSDDDLILFDYADILYYNDGSNTPNTVTYQGVVYPIITNSNAVPNAGSHISAAGELRIGKALWWLLARIAGWDGIETD